ncbi:MAG TPA: hypothetical protein VK209_01610 [Candidatus Sulfotelmatobacter sp.]|nr:hypothetical protein [Candidatus Sulfotelmatobacter sp.]
MSLKKERLVIVGPGEFDEIDYNYFNRWLDCQAVECKLLYMKHVS